MLMKLTTITQYLVHMTLMTFKVKVMGSNVNVTDNIVRKKHFSSGDRPVGSSPSKTI